MIIEVFIDNGGFVINFLQSYLCTLQKFVYFNCAGWEKQARKKIDLLS